MKTALTIDSAGRVVPPSEARCLVNLRPGSRLRVAVVAERIKLTPEAEDAAGLVLSASRRRVLGPTGKPFNATAAARAERNAQARPHKQR